MYVWMYNNLVRKPKAKTFWWSLMVIRPVLCAKWATRRGMRAWFVCACADRAQGMGVELGEGPGNGVQLAPFCWPAKLLTSCLASNVDNPMEHLVGSVRFKCFMNLFQWSQTRCVRVRVRAYHTYVYKHIDMSHIHTFVPLHSQVTCGNRSHVYA